jgi:hypothetical protein
MMSATGTQAQDRRKYRRTPFDGRVMVESPHASRCMSAVDLSFGGIRLRGEAGFTEGAIVELYFELGGRAIEVRGHVVRAEDGSLCVAFDERPKSSPPRSYRTLPPTAS